MDFNIVRGTLPSNLNTGAIERAVEKFIKDSGCYKTADAVGMFNQTLSGIFGCVYKNTGDFWLAVDEDGEVQAYAMGHVSTEVDNQLTYWLSQAWVDKSARGSKTVKGFWQKMRAQALKYFCKHIVVVSGRGTEAYCRFLGKGWHEYARLLKEDL
jgi:hypothetical protein